MRPRGRARGEEGASLVFALAFIMLLSAISVSVLGLSGVSSRSTTVTRDRAGQLYAADAGIEYAIQKLQAEEWCMAESDTPSPPFTLPTPINGKTVTLTCQTTFGGQTTNSGSPLLGDYVAVLGDEGVRVTGGGWDRATFHGSVYSGGPASIWWEPIFYYDGDYPIPCSEWWDDPALGFPHAEICAWIDIEGNLDVDQADCPPQYVYPTGVCTGAAAEPNIPVPKVSIPTATALTPVVAGNCTILYPGRYTNTSPPLSFNASKRYYMASGTYYFAGDNDVVLQGQIFGGAPSPATPWEDAQLMKQPASACANDATAEEKSKGSDGQPRYIAANAGTGVTIVRGGRGKVRVQHANTKIELYTRVPVPGDGADPGVTFWALKNPGPQDTIGGTYAPSDPSSGEVFVTQHKDADVVIHGLSYLPDLHANLQEPFNADVGTGPGTTSFFLGGVVAKKLTVVRNLEGFVQKVALAGTGEPIEAFDDRTTTVTATAPSASGAAATTVTAVVKPDESSGPAVVSWWQG